MCRRRGSVGRPAYCLMRFDIGVSSAPEESAFDGGEMRGLIQCCVGCVDAECIFIAGHHGRHVRLRRLFHAWRHAAGCRASQNRKISDCETRHGRMLVSKVFRRWKQQWEGITTLADALRDESNRRELRNTWHRWTSEWKRFVWWSSVDGLVPKRGSRCIFLTHALCY